MTYIKLCGQSRICASHPQAMSFMKTEQAMSANIKLEKKPFITLEVSLLELLIFPSKSIFHWNCLSFECSYFEWHTKSNFFLVLCVLSACVRIKWKISHTAKISNAIGCFLGALFERTLYPWFGVGHKFRP